MELLGQTMNILRLLMPIQKVHQNLIFLIIGMSLFFCAAYIGSILSNRGGGKREKEEDLVKCVLICGYTNMLKSIIGIGSQSDLDGSPIYHSVAVWAWTNYLTSLSMSSFLKWQYGPHRTLTSNKQDSINESTQH